MEGVKRYCVRLLNHNEQWTEEFQKVKQSIQEHWADNVLDIRHGNPLHHLFVLRGPGEISLQHIHCYDQTAPEFDQIVGFRDYLNAHPDAARQYEALKKDLAEKYPDNRPAYTKGKEDFIQNICEKF